MPVEKAGVIKRNFKIFSKAQSDQGLVIMQSTLTCLCYSSARRHDTVIPQSLIVTDAMLLPMVDTVGPSFVEDRCYAVAIGLTVPDVMTW